MGPINLDDNGNPDFEETLRLEGGILKLYITGYLEPRRWNDQESVWMGSRTTSLASDGSEGLSSPLVQGSIWIKKQTKSQPVRRCKLRVQWAYRWSLEIVYQRSRSTVHGADIATLSPISGSEPHGRDLHIPEEKLNRIFSEPTPVEFNLEETGVFIHLQGKSWMGAATVRMVNRIEPEGDISAVGRATSFNVSSGLIC